MQLLPEGVCHSGALGSMFLRSLIFRFIIRQFLFPLEQNCFASTVTVHLVLRISLSQECNPQIRLVNPSRDSPIPGLQHTVSRDAWRCFLLLDTATPGAQPLSMLLHSLPLTPELACWESMAESMVPKVARGGREGSRSQG